MKNLFDCWKYSKRVWLTFSLLISTLVTFATISGPTSVCEGDVVSYTFPYTLGNTYSWFSSGGTGTATINTGNNTAVFTVTWGVTGTGSINIQEFSGNTLTSNFSNNVSINSAPNPQISSDFDSDCVDVPSGPTPNTVSFNCETVCEGNTVNYSTNNQSGNTYQWTVIGDFTSITGASTNSASITWGNPGQASVIVTETTPSGCSQTSTICIMIIERPTSLFTVDQGAGLIQSEQNTLGLNEIQICIGSTVCFNDASSGGSKLFWDFGNGNSSQQQNPCETYTSDGTFTCLLYTSPSPRDKRQSRMPSSA